LAGVAGLLGATGCSSAGVEQPDPTGVTASALQNVAFSQLASSVGNGGNVQILGLGAGSVYLDDWQNNQNSGWSSGTNSPLSAAPPTYSMIAVGEGFNGSSSALQVVGLAATQAPGYAYIAAWQDSSGTWHSGFELPSQSASLSTIAVAPGTGSTPTLQVVGLASSTGHGVLAGWQDDTGVWHGGFALPSQSTAFSAIAMSQGRNGSSPALQVVGLGTNGQVSVAAWQNSSGTWFGNAAIPAQTPSFSAMATGAGFNGADSSALQVVALAGGTGYPYLAAWQNNAGVWFAGFSSPFESVSFSTITTGEGTDSSGRPQLEALGLSGGKLQLAAWQDYAGNWSDGGTYPQSMYSACNDPGVSFSEVTAVQGNGALQVVAYSAATERSYLCYESQGTWHGYGVLP
jgi:hypothetical protein